MVEVDVQLFREQVWRDIQLTKVYLDKVFDPVVQSEGLTMLQALVLLGLEQRSIDTVGSLCRATGMGQANASNLCKKLERDGFLRRARSEDGGRVVSLLLTEQGKGAIKRLEGKFQAYDVVLRTMEPQKFDAVLQGIAAAREILHRIYAYQQADKGGTQLC